MAQVYAPPIVTYVNITIPQGYSLLTSLLLVSGKASQYFNEVADIFGTKAQNGYTVFTMDGSGFKADNYLNGWTDPELVLLPGTAWFCKSPYAGNILTIIGDVPDGTNQLPSGFSACASIVPAPGGGFSDNFLFPSTNGDRVFTFNNLNNTYSVYTFTNNNWLPAEPSIAVGQSFWVSKSSGADWDEVVYDAGDIDPWLHVFLTQPQLNSQTGQLNFFTFNAADAGAGQVMDTAGNLLSTNSLGQLYAGTNANESAFVALGTPVSFSGTMPGYISSGVVSVPFVAGGQVVYVQLRAWQQADGASFEQASAWGAPVGKSSTMILTAHATIEGNQPGIPPPDVNSFPSFQLVGYPLAPLEILGPHLSGANLIFSFASFPSQYYLLWTCTDLTTMNWVPVTFFVGTGSPLQVSMPVTSATPQQFFRLQAVNIPD